MRKIFTTIHILVALTTTTAFGEEFSMLELGNAVIYYETAGSGQPIIFLHAGVADSRQWNNEFRYFSKNFSVTRYDMRGFGESEPVAGEFTHLDDLAALLGHLNIDQPAILVGCSMGGRTALDFALEYPNKVKALVLVDSAPSGLHIDLPTPAKFALVETADEAGNLELVAELETQIWFDGDRETQTVDQEMRKLAHTMNFLALQHDAKGLGKRSPNTATDAIERLDRLEVPVLSIVGENDIPYMHAAAEALAPKISNYRQVTIKNAAHLPNMDQPAIFQNLLTKFIESIPSKAD